jgi:hypothetical protein
VERSDTLTLGTLDHFSHFTLNVFGKPLSGGIQSLALWARMLYPFSGAVFCLPSGKDTVVYTRPIRVEINIDYCYVNSFIIFSLSRVSLNYRRNMLQCQFILWTVSR